MELLNTELLVHNLVECLEDTYESNQIKALHLLHTIPSSTRSEENVKDTITKAFSYLYSSRAQDSLSAAYLFLSLSDIADTSLQLLRHVKVEQVDLAEVVNSLSLTSSLSSKEKLSISLVHIVLHIIKHQVKKAADDLVLASQCCPLYPALMTLRYLLKSADMTDTNRWSDIIQQVFEVTYDQIKPLVAPVVCHSSPEGYLPPQQDSSQSATRPQLPQYLVVCCWRTVKEISLIYGDMMDKVVVKHPLLVSKCLICEYIKEFYEYILLKAKHRGAFEMAYTGYCSYWHTVWRLSSCRDLVAGFLTNSPYSMLLEKESADVLCATRRSAGLPFMIQAYVTSEPRLNNYAALRTIMDTLLPMSMEGTDNTFSINQRIHALNVLRSLYRTSALGDAVQPFISAGVKSAISGYKTQVWGVRNASTLLFSSLVTRMFGVKLGKDDLSKQSGMAGRLFFQKYPEMQPFLLKELKNSTEFTSSSGQTLLQPSLYLLLIVLCKLYPSQKESADARLSLEVFVPLLHRCASSPVYKARMLSALALANVVSHDSITETVSYLCHSIVTASGHNRMHGLLLQLYHLYASIPSPSSTDPQVTLTLVHMFEETHPTVLTSRCDLVKAAYLDVLRLAKPRLCPKHPDVVSKVTSAALLNVRTADWSCDSVDLQLARSRLLLNCEQACTREALLSLLSEEGMYEVHHEILASLQVKLLTVNDLIHVMREKITLNNRHLSYNTALSIDMLADGISDTWSTGSVSLVHREVIQHLIDGIAYGDHSLSVVRLQASILTAALATEDQSGHVACVLDQLLAYLRGDNTSPEGQAVCVDIVGLVSEAIFTTRAHSADTIARVPESFWVASVLLLLALDDQINSAACLAFGKIMAKRGQLPNSACDPHSTVKNLLNWMSSVYSRQEVLAIWKNWLANGHLWLADSCADNSTEEPEDSLFSKAEGQLLCDPQSFKDTLNTSCSQLVDS